MSEERVEVYATFGGASVFYPGRIFVENPPPPEAKRRRCCPRCEHKATTSDRTGNSVAHYVFTCSKCISPSDRGPTTWREEKGV